MTSKKHPPKNVISTEAAHSLIVSSASENPLLNRIVEHLSFFLAGKYD